MQNVAQNCIQRCFIWHECVQNAFTIQTIKYTTTAAYSYNKTECNQGYLTVTWGKHKCTAHSEQITIGVESKGICVLRIVVRRLEAAEELVKRSLW